MVCWSLAQWQARPYVPGSSLSGKRSAGLKIKLRRGFRTGAKRREPHWAIPPAARLAGRTDHQRRPLTAAVAAPEVSAKPTGREVAA